MDINCLIKVDLDHDPKLARSKITKTIKITFIIHILILCRRNISFLGAAAVTVSVLSKTDKC